MAYGLADTAGVFALPSNPTLGYESWAEMTTMNPAHPLVGGTAGEPGYGRLSRQVAIATPVPMQAAASGAPAAKNWRELFNLKGNPIGWVLIAALLYLALMHLHLRAGAGIDYRGRRR